MWYCAPMVFPAHLKSVSAANPGCDSRHQTIDYEAQTCLWFRHVLQLWFERSLLSRFAMHITLPTGTFPTLAPLIYHIKQACSQNTHEGGHVTNWKAFQSATQKIEIPPTACVTHNICSGTSHSHCTPTIPAPAPYITTVPTQPLLPHLTQLL